MKQKVGHTIESYFEYDYQAAGRYDFPLLRRQDIDLSDLKLLRFSSATKVEKCDFDATLHFFENDERFDEVWKKPAAYLEKLGQYKQLLTPDFSVYRDMPLMMQLINTYRNRWCGAYWQAHGLVVAPSITWSDERSFRFCFDGIERGSIVAVSTLGCRDIKELFMAGFGEMCEIIEPASVICYNKPFDEMKEMAQVIEVPYARNARLAARV